MLIILVKIVYVSILISYYNKIIYKLIKHKIKIKNLKHLLYIIQINRKILKLLKLLKKYFLFILKFSLLLNLSIINYYNIQYLFLLIKI